MKLYRYFVKRFIDLLASVLALILTLPVFIIIIPVLTYVNRGKVFFFQRRPGLNEKIFLLYKFKTMSDKRDEKGKLLPDNERLTRTGRFIRSLSIDELPQLLNVLKGEMSLVGPRPLLIKYLSLYSSHQRRRHEVKPGITGWAQVNGRNSINWEERLNMDVWYVDNLSFIIDCKIIFLTILKVFRKEGINATTDVTMKPFTGNN